MVVAPHVHRFSKSCVAWVMNVACPGSVGTGLNGVQGETQPTDIMGKLTRLCITENNGETKIHK